MDRESNDSGDGLAALRFHQRTLLFYIVLLITIVLGLRWMIDIFCMMPSTSDVQVVSTLRD